MSINFDSLVLIIFNDCQGVNIVPEEFVAVQLKSVLSDMQVDVVIQIIDCVIIFFKLINHFLGWCS